MVLPLAIAMAADGYHVHVPAGSPRGCAELRDSGLRGDLAPGLEAGLCPFCGRRERRRCSRGGNIGLLHHRWQVEAEEICLRLHGFPYSHIATSLVAVPMVLPAFHVLSLSPVFLDSAASGRTRYFGFQRRAC